MRPAKARRPQVTGIGGKKSKASRPQVTGIENFSIGTKKDTKKGHKKREPFGSLSTTCLSYFMNVFGFNSFIKPFERLITLVIE